MKTFVATALLAFTAISHASDTYLGLFLNGQKIGYSSYSSLNTTLNGKATTRSDSRTVMGAGLLGAGVKILIDSSTWTDGTGRPLQMKFVMTSAGRTQKVDATFGAKTVDIAVDNTGTKSKQTLPIPSGHPIVDDPMSLVLNGNSARTFYVLDPTTVSFVKNTIETLGVTTTKVRGKSVSGQTLKLVDPRAITKVWVTAKGDVLKVEAPMGIEMLPITKQEALASATSANPTVDLAEVTRIKADKDMGDPASLTGLKIRLEGRDLARVPSDGFQTVTKDGNAWIIDIHPPIISDGASATIHDAAVQKPDWVRDSLNMPASSTRFKNLAAKLVGAATDVRTASLKIRSYVHDTLRPNAGIGVLRDANDVLDTKEGVCRDYAILTCTLCRAAGIPSRLVSGLVSWDGNFYYHAWVEVWDGSRWLGIDSTAEADQISAAHVKLADGNVDEAFTFTFLQNAKLSILSMKRGSE